MKVLVIRFSSIGDIVLTTPVVRAIKTQLKDTELHYLTKKQYREVLEGNPYIDRLHFLEDELSAVIRELKDEGFDYIADLHKNIRSKKVVSALKAGTASFDKLNWEKWLLVNFGINKLPDKHIVDRYFQAVGGLDIHPDEQGLDYFIDENSALKAQSILEENGKDYYVFVLAATYYTKKYPLEKVIELIRKLDKAVYLLGGKNEAEEGARIADQLPDKAINLCGQTGLNESAYIVKEAQLVFTNDTGLMHIAAAFRKKTVVFWGNTIPGFGMYPYLTHHYHAEVDGLRCRPCSKLGYKKKCPKGHFRCMLDIDQDSILRWIAS